MFKNLRLFLDYKKTLKENLTNLNINIKTKRKNNYIIKNIDLDWAGRLYTVLNLDSNLKENLRKYGHSYIDNEVRKYLKDMDEELNELGLRELYGLDRADQISKYTILVVIRFSRFNVVKFYKKLIYWSILILGGLIYGLIKII